MEPPHCGPILQPRIMMWTDLNLHYLKMLSNRFQLFMRRFLKNNIFENIFLIISPFKKELGVSFQQTWISFIQRCFVRSLFKIGSLVLESLKCKTTTDRHTDEGLTNSNQNGILKLSAKSYLFSILDWETILLFLKYAFQNLAADFLLPQYWCHKLYSCFLLNLSEKNRNKIPSSSHFIYYCILYRLKSRVLWKSLAWDVVHIKVIIYFNPKRDITTIWDKNLRFLFNKYSMFNAS